mmetsp:Transcript_33231/g.43790  ORF Transcript_33231/g.43790 Transcript_33231/m.43790 type:complete len:910 (-) Transcript_33231:391-3120(-)|eukprot:CAMPEP_0117761806 /NCGR_PEP_ID=MMETSP0947-20121206/17503_1 /TAXON_ID=44440 /ORGANISM="Chattonella subsalsa, Strain CCMP2191" /LENGTH=909 /DNA_ID=CAMNT_0005582875 /DNA_START=51 /DNA_END=2780 /DNA_ORIENTATION=-
MAQFVGRNDENQLGILSNVDGWVSQGGTARDMVLAEKYAKKWKKFTAKKTSGYVISRGKRPASIICHYDLYDKDGEDKLSLPFGDEWMSYLRVSRMKGQKFTDSNFPPDERSLFFDPENPREVELKHDVQKWVRISEMFNKSRFIKLTFFDDDSFKLCGFETMEEGEFQGLEMEMDIPSKERAQQKGEDICMATLGSRKLEIDYSMDLLNDSPIRDWLEKNKIFDTVLKSLSPLVLVSFGEVKYEYISQPGYVPTISVIMECQFKPDSKIAFFQRGTPDEPFVKPGDVAQGALGDCYYLGALSVLSVHEDLLFDCFPDLDENLWNPDEESPPNEQQFNEEGVYAMAFYRNKERRIVVVDDWIPCNAAGRPVFCQPPRDSTEIWTLLAEKAFAKLNGSYEGIVGGLEKEALQDLTGGLPLSYQISGADMEERWSGHSGEEELYNFMKDLLNEGSMIGCSVGGEGIEEEVGHGILSNHAYGVLKIHELYHEGEDYRLVQIRNPWGHGKEWDGAWSDSDPRWAQVSSHTKDEMGVIEEADGTWWMDFLDFKDAYSEIQVCRLLKPPVWTHHHVIGKWEGHTAGGTENIHLNPQFQLFLEHDCKVYVELRQPSRRPLGKETYEVAIAPVVVRDCEPGQRRVIIRQQDIEDKLVLAHSRSRVIELNLKASDKPYNLIACSGQKGYEAEFFMEIYTRGPSRVDPLHDDALPCCAQCNELLHGAFITIEEKSIHKECYEEYKLSTAVKCAHCGEAVCQMEGKFSGRYYALDGGKQVHLECYTEYQSQAAPSCGHCGKGIFKIEGQFSGVYYDVADGGKIHEECWEAYRLSKADRCIECGEPVARVEGRFNGKYFAVDEGKVHAECWDKHRQSTAPKCIHCDEPCCEIVGRFSGMFYELGDDKGHCHVECFDSYTSQ